MNNEWQQALLTLLASVRISFLATQGKTAPEASMAPYAVYRGDVLLHLSALARHSTNLKSSPAIGVMICAPEQKGESPLALPRVSLIGKAMILTGDAAIAARACYLNRIPEAEPLFDFPDFNLYSVQIQEARWVGGFGNARALSADSWYRLWESSPIKPT